MYVAFAFLDFKYLSSVAARLTVIDYPDATLLWIYCQRHSRRLNDNDPDKQLQSLFAARTQRMSAGNDSEGDMLNALPQVSASNSLYVHTEVTRSEPIRWFKICCRVYTL